jgi:KaiC/GvpD/RAD55 family RecA-like ATPase
MKQEALSEREIALRAKEDELKKAAERAQRLIARSDKQMNELVDKEASVLKREKDLADREAEVKNALATIDMQMEDAQRAKAAVGDREKQYISLSEATRSKLAEVAGKEQEMARKMAALERREASIKDLEKRLKAEQDQMNSKLRTILEKEKDVKAAEAKVALKHAELKHMERDVLTSVRDVETARHGVSPETTEGFKSLEVKEKHLREKEQEMKSRLYQREKELEKREQALQLHLKKDLDEMETEVQTEIVEEKVKTGIERLDDLLLGGMPFASNVLFIGPPFIGKEVAMLLFIAEGLKKGVPAVIITTSKPPHEIAMDMAPIMPTFLEFEQLGLVHWIDASGLGSDPGSARKNSVLVKGADDFEGISKALDALSKSIIGNGSSYFRLAYLSLSMSVTSAGEKRSVQFIQELSSRVRQSRAVAVFALEKGMHTEQHLGSIQAQMTGAVHFKTEKQKTLLSVEGICDTQTRNWVDYRHTNKALMIGAFSLERIR